MKPQFDKLAWLKEVRDKLDASFLDTQTEYWKARDNITKMIREEEDGKN